MRHGNNAFLHNLFSNCIGNILKSSSRITRKKERNIKISEIQRTEFQLLFKNSSIRTFATNCHYYSICIVFY